MLRWRAPEPLTGKPATSTPPLETECELWRRQVIGGRLYVTDIRALWFARQFTASAKLTLLAVLRNFKGEIPDLDIVVNQGDYPVVLMPKSVEVRKYYQELSVATHFKAFGFGIWHKAWRLCS
jgi:hypothetical protein